MKNEDYGMCCSRKVVKRWQNNAQKIMRHRRKKRLVEVILGIVIYLVISTILAIYIG